MRIDLDFLRGTKKAKIPEGDRLMDTEKMEEKWTQEKDR